MRLNWRRKGVARTASSTEWAFDEYWYADRARFEAGSAGRSCVRVEKGHPQVYLCRYRNAESNGVKDVSADRLEFKGHRRAVGIGTGCIRRARLPCPYPPHDKRNTDAAPCQRAYEQCDADGCTAAILRAFGKLVTVKRDSINCRFNAGVNQFNQ
jgi:hypothetical protein